MRILFGGTFDPIHNGHLLIANTAQQHIADSTVLFIPALKPPHREQPIASAKDRLTMVKLAIAPYAAFDVNEIEYRRDGISYTSDTIDALRQIYPDEPLGLLIGQDSYEQLHTWHAAEYILKHTTLLVISRYDKPIENQQLPAHQIERIVIPPCPISATEIRARVSLGESIETLVPDVIAGYIEQHGIYS